MENVHWYKDTSFKMQSHPFHGCLLSENPHSTSSTLRKPSATQTQRANSKMTQRTTGIRKNKLAAVLKKL